MNTRDWNDKGRKEIIKFFLHTRKVGWDVFLLVQHIDMLDKQLRNAVVEHLVVCKRRSRKNPIHCLTASNCRILRQVHEAAYSIGQYGKSNHAPVVNRWYYMAWAYFTQACSPVTTHARYLPTTPRLIRCCHPNNCINDAAKGLDQSSENSSIHRRKHCRNHQNYYQDPSIRWLKRSYETAASKADLIYKPF